jgi:hypothetical protein
MHEYLLHFTISDKDKRRPRGEINSPLQILEPATWGAVMVVKRLKRNGMDDGK